MPHAHAEAGASDPIRWHPVFRCPGCGCQGFARVDERKSDGRFAPGPLVRCIGCKREFHSPDPFAALAPAAVPESVRRLMDLIWSQLEDRRADLFEQSNITSNGYRLGDFGKVFLCLNNREARTLLATSSSVQAGEAVSAPASAGAVDIGSAAEIVSAAYYDAMIGQVPHTHGWAGKPDEFKRKVRARMAGALRLLPALAAAPATPEPAAGGERATLSKLSDAATQGFCAALRYTDDEGGAYLDIGGLQVASGLTEEDADFIAAAVNGARSILSASTADGETAGDGQKTIPCGGCGTTSSEHRCLGCLHDFGDVSSAWVRKYNPPTPTRPDATAEDATPATPAEGR